MSTSFICTNSAGGGVPRDNSELSLHYLAKSFSQISTPVRDPEDHLACMHMPHHLILAHNFAHQTVQLVVDTSGKDIVDEVWWKLLGDLPFAPLVCLGIVGDIGEQDNPGGVTLCQGLQTFHIDSRSFSTASKMQLAVLLSSKLGANVIGCTVDWKSAGSPASTYATSQMMVSNRQNPTGLTNTIKGQTGTTLIP